jgi:hypothetical protein
VFVGIPHPEKWISPANRDFVLVFHNQFCTPTSTARSLWFLRIHCRTPSNAPGVQHQQDGGTRFQSMKQGSIGGFKSLVAINDLFGTIFASAAGRGLISQQIAVE